MKFLFYCFTIIIYILSVIAFNEPFFRKRKVTEDDKIAVMENEILKEKNKNKTNIEGGKIKKKSEKKIQREIKKMKELLNGKSDMKSGQTGKDTKEQKEKDLPIAKGNSVKKSEGTVQGNQGKQGNQGNQGNQGKQGNNINSINTINILTNIPPPKPQNSQAQKVKNQKQISPSKTTSPSNPRAEFTLPEITIERTRKIETFYPYFMKANLIEMDSLIDKRTLPYNFNLNSFQMQQRSMSNNNNHIGEGCMDPLCELCDINNRITCLQCLPGHFLLNSKCYSACPQNYIADVYERKCMPMTLRTRNTFSRVTYLKAFSTGSCKNMCGKLASDCSCQPDCTQYGNCCSDYRDCEVLVRKNTNRERECASRNPNCELCADLDNPENKKCGQCKPGLFLRNDECMQFCDASDRAMKENMLCFKSNKCLVDNCLECEDGNPSVCKQCLNGFYLYNNMCHMFCPGTLRADRMNWVCLEPSVFSWYWIFPSKSSCRNKCDITIGPERDCSCRDDCIRYGNCCQDIEEYCYKFVLS